MCPERPTKVSKPKYEATALCSHQSIGYPNSFVSRYVHIFYPGQIAAHNLSNILLFFSALADASGKITRVNEDLSKSNTFPLHSLRLPTCCTGDESSLLLPTFLRPGACRATAPSKQGPKKRGIRFLVKLGRCTAPISSPVPRRSTEHV
jgi:hypothetical protein